MPSVADPLVSNELKFKEVLYLCLEDLKSTKAALFLMGEMGDFVLVTSYGFTKRDTLPRRLGKTAPVVEHVFYERKTFFANSVTDIAEIGEYMVSAATSRILVAPLYFQGRIVGFVDARDKAGNAPFKPEDVARAEGIVQHLLHLLGTLGLYGGSRSAAPVALNVAGGRSLLDADVTMVTSGAFEKEPTAAPSRAPSAAPAPSAPPPPRAEAQTPLPARISRLEAEIYRDLSQALVANTEVELAAISVWDGPVTGIFLGARREVAQDVRDEIMASARAQAIKQNPATEPGASTVWSNAIAPSTRDGLELVATRSELARIESFEIEPRVVATIGFRRIPAVAADLAGTWRGVAARALGNARDLDRYRGSFKSMVNKILEPELRKFTALKNHSFSVGRLARQLCQYLSFGDEEVEQITVAAILHDIGMKEIQYDEIYQKPKLSDEQFTLVKEHPRVGAAMLGDVKFPYPVVELVLHHHERYDGSGYPDRLRGEAIPLGARIIGIIEAFDAMTSRTSYRQPVTVDKALDIILSKGGTQFDPGLAESFREMVLKLREARGA